MLDYYDAGGWVRADNLLAIFAAKATECEAKAEACRPSRDMVTQAVHAGFAAGMRFAAEEMEKARS